MNVIPASILSVILSSLLLLEVKAVHEISLERVFSTEDHEMVGIGEDINPSELPITVTHPRRSDVKISFYEEGGKIHLETDGPSHKYLLVDTETNLCSGVQEISKGNPHQVGKSIKEELSIFLEK